MTETSFELGAWRVEPARGLLVALESGAEVRLEPRLMDLLLLLAGSDGRVLSKGAITAGVWDGRAVGDDTIAAAISRLRSALRESKDDRYIETVPKRGYRLAKTAPAHASASRNSNHGTGRAAQYLSAGEAALRAAFAPNLAAARDAFEAAIAADPSLAAAHAGLSEALLAQHLGGANASLLGLAKSSALAAAGIDKHCARAFASLGFCKLIMDREFAPAERDLAKAISLDPMLPSAHIARAFAFASTGRFVDAERDARRAVELDPLSSQSHGFLLQILIAARRYTWAIAAAGEASSHAPHAAEASYAKGWASALKGDESQAVEAFLHGLKLWGLPDKRLTNLRESFGGENGFAHGCAAAADLFEEQSLVFRPRIMDVAILRAAARQFDQAFAALEKALARDDPYLMFLPWYPHFDLLRQDPRFAALLRRVRLVR